MKRIACVVSALAVLVLAAGADDATTPSIKDVMTQLHKGANAPLASPHFSPYPFGVGS